MNSVYDIRLQKATRSSYKRHMGISTELTSLMWAFCVIMMYTTQALAQYPTPPLPPSSTRPTWPPIADDRFRTSSTTETSPADATSFWDRVSEWPWWWWLSIAAVLAVVIVLIVALCVCFCCTRCCRCCCNKRKTPMQAEVEDGNSVRYPNGFQRMNSSTAKRYLHNVVSMFSWGSDFDERETTRQSRPVTNLYANTESLAIERADSDAVPPARPPRKPRPKSGEHYINLSTAVRPQRV